MDTLCLTKCLKTHYGIEAATLTFLPLGADSNASVYKAETHDKKSYFIKLKRNYNQEISAIITQLLEKVGIQHVILPIKTLNGQLTQKLDDSILIVYPFITGEDGFTRSLAEEQWHLLGKALRQIHETEVPLSIQQQIRKETYSSVWRQVVKAFFTRINVETFHEEFALKFITTLREQKEIIQKLVEGAERLSHKLKKQSAPYVLCHADIHGGNVLIDENNTLYIVDWDDPMMAPKERDLMFIGGGVANVWNDPHEEKAFYQGYGHTQVNKELIAYYRQERIVEDIAEFGEQLLSPTLAHIEKQQAYKYFIDMFAPRGVVEIALGKSF